MGRLMGQAYFSEMSQAALLIQHTDLVSNEEGLQRWKCLYYTHLILSDFPTPTIAGLT